MGRPGGILGKKLHKWTDEEVEYIKEITPGRYRKEILKLMNEKFEYEFTLNQIKAALTRYKLNTGFTGRFELGHVPPNKGTKGISKANKTSFQKGVFRGNRHDNSRAVGSERVNIYGYTEIKVAEPNKWALKHKVVWEEHNGPIGKGYAVIFGDGDKSNTDISNLILVTRQQLLILNRKKLIQNDVELTKTGIAIADIFQKIYEKEVDLKGS